MKRKLRQQKLLERLKHQTSAKASKSHKIISKLQKFSIFKKAKNILLYLPIHGEVDLTSLITKKNDMDHDRGKSKGKQKSFILPRVNGKKLDLFYVKNIDEVEMAKFKVLEPKKHLPKAKIKEIDLILTPGIVFSIDGHRIGYGKGFYDRLLKKAKCPKIGIAYDFQIVKNTAAEKHDVPMDMIITEKRIIKPRINLLSPSRLVK